VSDAPAAERVRIRDANERDRDLLVGFATAMAHETEDLVLDPDVLGPGVAALLADPRKGRVFVLEEDGAPAATLMLTTEWSDWRNGWFWWIQSVYVAPTCRRRGHYRRLHEHVRALAASEPDVYGLRLYVERENAGAQATYRALGMHETGYRLFEQATRRPR
jgi:ribosomal protein S18 acetylase RimI-like enzyme